MDVCHVANGIDGTEMSFEMHKSPFGELSTSTRFPAKTTTVMNAIAAKHGVMCMPWKKRMHLVQVTAWEPLRVETQVSARRAAATLPAAHDADTRRHTPPHARRASSRARSQT